MPSRHCPTSIARTTTGPAARADPESPCSNEIPDPDSVPASLFSLPSLAGLELVLLCLAVSAGLRSLAERLNVPYAAVLVVGGLLLALTPGTPQVTLPPDV